MPSYPVDGPIVELDAELRVIVDDPGADLPPLLAALAYLTGDSTLLDPGLHLDPDKVFDEQGGWTAAQQIVARDAAFRGLVALRDASRPVGDELADVGKIVSWLAGVDVDGSYLTMLLEELALTDPDPRAPHWSRSELAPSRDFHVAIIGAGMSGILVAHRLKQVGVSVTIVEKNSELGGTWHENSYPGCRVDVSNHVYSYSFAQKHDWPEFHSSQRVLLAYFNECADRFGVRSDITFDTEVTAITWDEARKSWTLDVGGPGGEHRLEADAVISAVGQLNRPKFPDIEGLDTFAGPSFHSAQWDHDVDLVGKRVGVIGTGCSATQFIPHVADVASQLTVFQRTPNWLAPCPLYRKRVPDTLNWLMEHVPHYSNWFRLRLFWQSHVGLLPRLEVDPDWSEPSGTSVSYLNDELRQLLTLYLEVEFGDRPDLLAKVVPTYPAGAKRLVIDDGNWAQTLKQEHVDVCTVDIDRVTPSGIRTVDGIDHDLDVLIYGTGFTASEFLAPMKVVGRGGADLHEEWAGDARAYLGIVSPGFPNFFYMYGPNTNIVINGSIIFFSECEAHYITDYVRHLLETGDHAMDVRRDVHDQYNEWIDAGNMEMVWGVSTVNSWYKTNGGRVAQNWPYSMLEYWEQTRAINPSDYKTL